MSIHEDALVLLKEIYDETQRYRLFERSQDFYRNLSREDRLKLDNSLKYLEELNYVSEYAATCGYPISYTITAKGIMQIEKIEQEKPTTSIETQINFNGTNNGILATNATSNTINNSSKQIDDIIDSIIKSNEESQQKISELITLLKTSKPENKGKIRVLLEHIKDTQSLYASFFNFIGKMWGTN